MYKQKLGKRGEEIAVRFLRQKGYRIITRNFSCRLGEIDIIARDGNDIVFIEVRTRTSFKFGLPQESIGTDKLKHLWHCAQFYIKGHASPEENFRFDLVCVVAGDTVQINHIKNIL